jgi:hypothetical protein
MYERKCDKEERYGKLGPSDPLPTPSNTDCRLTFQTPLPWKARGKEKDAVRRRQYSQEKKA